MRTLLSGAFNWPPVPCDAAGLPLLTPRYPKPLSPPLPRRRTVPSPVSPKPTPALLRLQADVVFLCSGTWRCVLVSDDPLDHGLAIDHIDWAETEDVKLGPGSATVQLKCVTRGRRG